MVDVINWNDDWLLNKSDINDWYDYIDIIRWSYYYDKLNDWFKVIGRYNCWYEY